jgi:hypothetical protein
MNSLLVQRFRCFADFAGRKPVGNHVVTLESILTILDSSADDLHDMSPMLVRNAVQQVGMARLPLASTLVPSQSCNSTRGR